MYEKVLAAAQRATQDVRNRDDWNLTHYMYATGQEPGRVRIPLDKAKQDVPPEAAAGKLFYPAKPTVPKKEEPAAPATSTGATPAGASAPLRLRQPPQQRSMMNATPYILVAGLLACGCRARAV